ncbi:MAG: aminoacyl-tRNA hydrolase [Gammaproteobacteria bacterium]|nr:aminoacyl-tRNA hydrolase [Gammaproteobacteria bacterium]MYF27950.1 aminoacyl-tRNA hydrolase [Gammaproteobacteria bacterium]MYK44941.1 aminoacyl-tRNA hydrolase [Gammaproteobacteria bacterium]
MAIRLIAGLGNPGKRYASTRHNIGAVWLESLARRFGIDLAEHRKFKGAYGRGDILGRDVRLLLPSTYVNLSGEAVGAVAMFYKIEPAEMLIAYDEVAFPAGRCRLKGGGGHNGHNGLKSVIAALGNDQRFARLRIGVGHPGIADEMVAYLTRVAMPAADREAATRAAWLSDEILDLVLEGDLQQAMNLFHAPTRTE